MTCAKKNGASFSQAIDAILAKYRRESAAGHLADLNARLFQQTLKGIEKYLRTTLLYYRKVVTLKDLILTENPTMRLSSDEYLITEGTQEAENAFLMNCAEMQALDLQYEWKYLQKQYNTIFGPFKQNATRKQSMYQKFEQDIAQAKQFTQQKETGRKSSRQKFEKYNENFLQQMIKINNDLELKVPDSFSRALAEYENTTQNPSTANKPYHLSISLSLNALRCMKYHFSKTFGGAPGTLLKKIEPKEDPKPISMPRTPASSPQNTPSVTPQTGPLPHTPTKTKLSTSLRTTPQKLTPTSSRHAKDKKAALLTPQQTSTNKFLKYQQDGLDQMLAQLRK